MPRCAATARASSTSRGPQHRPCATDDSPPRGSWRRIVMPTTRQPASTSSAAAVALSTPPESAATTRVSAPGNGRARGADDDIVWYSVARMARTCVVEATMLDEHGHGVGDAGGRAVHVTDLLPGERADVAIDHDSPHQAASWGHVLRKIGKSSPDRVKPACPRLGRCGGCTWQQLA